MLIAMCGLDGCGKTTQLRRLQKRLEDDYVVHATKQPTDWFRSDPTVRAFRSQELAPSPEVCVELALLSAADRMRQLRTEWHGRLGGGRIVLTDRHVLSAYASLMAAGLRDLEWMMEIHRFVPVPDLTFCFDVEPAVARRRVLGREDGRIHRQDLDLELQSAMREVFLSQPWGEHYLPDYRILDGSRSPGAIEREVAEIVTAALAARKRDAPRS